MVITQGIGKIKIALKGRYVSRSEMDDYHIIGTAKRRPGAGDLNQIGSQIVFGNPMGMSLKIMLVYQAVETGRMPPTVDKASERTSMKGVFCIVKKNRPKREVRSTTRQKITMKWFDEISQWSRGDQFLINSKRAPKPFGMGQSDDQLLEVICRPSIPAKNSKLWLPVQCHSPQSHEGEATRILPYTPSLHNSPTRAIN
jgi:hypothetical protein